MKTEIVQIPPKVTNLPKPKFKTVAATPKPSAKLNLIKKETEKNIDLKRKSLPANISKQQFSTPPTNNQNDLIFKKPLSANDRLTNFRKNLEDKKNEKILAYEDVEMEDFQINQNNLTNQTGSDEEMEWESITDEQILEGVTEMRHYYNQNNDDLLNIEISKDYKLDFSDEHFYVVVDTNIFLSNLGFLENLVGKNLKS